MIATIVAAAAMVSYAFLSGLIQIEVTDADKKLHDWNHSQPPKPPILNQFDESFSQRDDEQKSES